MDAEPKSSRNEHAHGRQLLGGLRTRRQVLVGAATLAATGAAAMSLVGVSAVGSPSSARYRAEELELAVASALVGENFQLNDADGGLLQLTDVKPAVPPEGDSVPAGLRARPFSMLFEILDGKLATSEIRTLFHPRLDPMPVFLHRTGPEHDVVEAVFA